MDKLKPDCLNFVVEPRNPNGLIDPTAILDKLRDRATICFPEDAEEMVKVFQHYTILRNSHEALRAALDSCKSAMAIQQQLERNHGIPGSEGWTPLIEAAKAALEASNG